MSRERTLTVAAVGLLVVSLLSAALLPGVIAEREPDRPVRPGPVQVVEAPVSAGDVTGETAELTLRTRLRHAGPPTPNVTVQFRAVDAESGLLTTRETVSVGTVTGDGERVVPGTLTVPREGGYRLEAVVFRNGTRVDTQQVTVSGLRALTPAYARANVSFTDDPVLPAVSVSVAEASNNRTTLSVSGSLTAGGPVGGDLAVRFVLRQADSSVVAARERVAVGDVRPGRTVRPTANLTVPSEYNYYVDAVLVRDGVVVDTARGVANLDPQETVSANESRRDVEFDVSDFEQGERDERRAEGAERTARTESAAPGFGAVTAAVALSALAFLARRWTA